MIIERPLKLIIPQMRDAFELRGANSFAPLVTSIIPYKKPWVCDGEMFRIFVIGEIIEVKRLNMFKRHNVSDKR